MWMKWLPWRFVVRNMARRGGFLDPLTVLSRLQRFAQPSEVAAPVELLRSGALLHARGLMNSQAIQHNLDWVWPYWVERQFDPFDDAFIPRAFSITHINLTHRNWTAVGIPDYPELPIVDPRGLVTPLYDGWSIDGWIVTESGYALIPSRLPSVTQQLVYNDNLMITTEAKADRLSLVSNVDVLDLDEASLCHIRLIGCADTKAWLVVALRPYNPEGVSFIHEAALSANRKGWRVNDRQFVYFDECPQKHYMSRYHEGDVYKGLYVSEEESQITCDVGMATAAALFELKPRQSREVSVYIPLRKKKDLRPSGFVEMLSHSFPSAGRPKKTEKKYPAVFEEENFNPKEQLVSWQQKTSSRWQESLQGHCRLQVPDEHFQFLYDAAIRTLILHSPEDVYPGPYTYRRFWFRDAAFILYAMLCAGLGKRVERVIDRFPLRQTAFGYFLSQEGEWDSNGEALWAMRRYCELTNTPPKPSWKKAIYHGAQWIENKRLPQNLTVAHAGLFPAGFSAEHFGPNDYYFWDDFWGVAGLESAGYLAGKYNDQEKAGRFSQKAGEFLRCLENSLQRISQDMDLPVIPASPYRRMDAGAIGSIVCGYPLQIFAPDDPRLKGTVDFLMENCLVHGGFFQDMTHSGINPYLTLHIAQVLLQMEDPRYFDLMTTVAHLASPTGQWPEAIHPKTKGGCMGDGQHTWAAAEWILMMRNCFIREDEKSGCLILCSGIPRTWLVRQKPLSFGPAPTRFGPVRIVLQPQGDKIVITWDAQWIAEEPRMEIRLPGFSRITAVPGQNSVEIV
ncbi:MAG TPA: hypothetical protein DD723_09870 [Candidatus Omnitrophica bacterium]|nr:MAG: hypothetical protein A2Z81_06250 [Omnitrophica WOR_2 bacterium GWA2_45_18]HBR15826.1 hypothetical protein [Candidatus Omnitrophota bacterium]